MKNTLLFTAIALGVLTSNVLPSLSAVSFPPERADKPLPKPNCPKGSTCAPRG